MDIKLNLPSDPFCGQIVTFTAPCDCKDVTHGLAINGEIYTVCDAAGNCVTGVGGAWCKGVQVSVILDCTAKKAYIQNADTNAYLEGRFNAIDGRKINGKELRGDIELSAEDVGARPADWMPTAEEVGALPSDWLSSDWMPTAEEVGARPADWMPTAEEVGARSADWMPSAEEVGARPADWMPTAADVGARADTWMPTATQVGALPTSGGTMTGTVTLKGIKLTSGVDYGTTLPSAGTAGRIFFKKVSS